MNQETIINAKTSRRRYLADLWLYRELFFFLAWRDVVVRYKQTVIGVSWSLIRPIVTVLVLTLVFNKFGGLESEEAPYALMVLSGVLPWQFFASALSDSGNSLLANTQLISKVYFPRLLIPASSIATSLLDFLISFSLLLLLFVWYSWWPPSQIIALPLFFLLVSLAAFGAGTWVSALMVKYRDFRFIVPFVVQFGLYISPVGFSASIVPEQYANLYLLNPMVGIIEGFRWCLLGGSRPPMLALISSGAITTFVCVTGVWYFRKTERTFADII